MKIAKPVPPKGQLRPCEARGTERFCRYAGHPAIRCGELELALSEGPLFYSNFVNVVGSPFDVAMDFGARAGDEDVEPELRVMMSWQHFKLFTAVAQRQIDHYEETIGPIPDLIADPDPPKKKPLPKKTARKKPAAK